MIRKFDIQNFGLFVDYKWNSHIGGDSSSDVFNKINIIYGRNYSGKTTLSRILRCIETGKIHDNYQNAKFSVYDDANVITESNLIYSGKIRVYNTDFINDNLSWLHDNENGEIKPFTLLGSDNIEAANKIKEIEVKLGSIEDEIGLYFELENCKVAYNKQKTLLETKEAKLYQRIQNHANQIIKKNKYFVQQGMNYNVTNIQNEITEIINSSCNYILDEKENSKHRAVIDEVEKTQINEIFIKRPNFDDRFKNAKLLLEKKIALSETLQELVMDSLLQDWVDKGRRYHREKKLNKCAFCGGVIDSERWRKLDAHFSKESEELKELIENEKSMLEDSLRQIESFLIGKGISKENYYSIFHDEFDIAKNKWDESVNNYKHLIEKMLKRLQERYDDIFNTKALENLTDNSNDIVDSIELFNQLSKKNNEKSVSLGDDKNDSRKLLRYSEIVRFLSEIEYKEEMETINNDKEKLIQPEKNIAELEKVIACLNEEKKQEELKLNDEGEAARKINNHLLNFFGHDGLSLEPEIVQNDIPKTRFVIKRANEKALNLSEGECSLISFCYFIAKMEDELNSSNNDQLIIYIDDPISSLDSNHIFFMFSLIESVIAKKERYDQLFISTHNLDFLKYIKRLTIPHGEGNRELVNHFIIEKRKKDIEYRCFLFKMPSYLKDYVTEYNFLFKEIYNIARPFKNGDRSRYFENNFTLLYNLSNNMRRFLECYLFYRYPNTDSPLNNLGKIFQNNIPALVNRVINEYSHLTWGDRGTLVMDVAEAETVAKEIIKAIMRDKDHFEALCDSIGVDKNIVLS